MNVNYVPHTLIIGIHVFTYVVIAYALQYEITDISQRLRERGVNNYSKPH